MKKAKFIFKSDEKELINDLVICKIEGNNIFFENDDAKYMLETDVFKFVRTKGDEEFMLYDENGIKAKLKLIDENIEVFINVIKFDYNFEDKKYTIKYNIESDENSVKTIILSFI